MTAQPVAQTTSHDLAQPAEATGIKRQMSPMSAQIEARMAGVIALITTTSGFTAIAVGNLVDYNDAAATAHNILGHETLFRLAVAGGVISLLYIAYTLLLYNLFRPVSRSFSLLAAWFSLVGCAVGAVNSLLLLAPLVVLEDTQFSSAFTVPQSHSVALLFLQLYAQGSNISMVLFGSYNLLIGYLIFKSIFLPRILGVLLAISGICYLINSFAIILSPAFAARLLPYILIPGGAELLLAFWLTIVGVNIRRWQEQAMFASSRYA